jgi:hypothetical protein
MTENVKYCNFKKQAEKNHTPQAIKNVGNFFVFAGKGILTITFQIAF